MRTLGVLGFKDRNELLAEPVDSGLQMQAKQFAGVRGKLLWGFDQAGFFEADPCLVGELKSFGAFRLQGC